MNIKTRVKLNGILSKSNFVYVIPFILHLDDMYSFAYVLMGMRLEKYVSQVVRGKIKTKIEIK